MERIPSWVISISLLLLLIYSANSEDDEAKRSLIAFLQKLSPANTQIAQDFGWNISSDPCVDGWEGVTCNNRTNSVQKIALEGLSLSGSIDTSLLCMPRSLVVVSLRNNSLQGNLPPEISNCTQLTHLFLSSNHLSGSLPSSLARLKNLKRLDISDNSFSGELSPDIAKISGLVTFLAQNNQLNGSIPQFDFGNLQQFNVSYNLFSGPIPMDGDRFGQGSFLGNSDLCGEPLKVACPPTSSPSPPEEKSKSRGEKTLIFSGYIVLGLLFVLFVAYKIVNRKKSTEEKGNSKKKESGGHTKPASTSSGYKTSRSEYSIATSNESAAAMPVSLVVLKNPATKELKLAELFKAPAELLGRGRFGSLYKVMMADGTALAVKRIKDWTVTAQEFQSRMERIDRARHPRVLSAVAFFCSKQEKLVVYEYKENGSLFKLLHGSQEGKTFDWRTRLGVAAGISEGLAFMHKHLYDVGIGHGNLKSSNILMDSNMQPCISEYGLLAIPKQNLPSLNNSINDSALKADIYSFGVILLELLTGKLVQNNGFGLAQWVHSVVREEWTVEVFDKALISEGVTVERMVRLLQVALKCINSSTDARPTMSRVATMIYSLREEEDRSMFSEGDTKEI